MAGFNRCHDLSEGGLAVALAEMCIAGRLGVHAEIGDWRLATDQALSALEVLFSESNGRLLVEVRLEDVAAVDAHFADVTFTQIGQVTDAQQLTIRPQ